MIVGIPKGLMYSKYHVFAKSFFEELGAEIAVSPDTNKYILDTGTSCCVDEACLPIKLFHGHVASLRDKCDAVLMPRFISLEKGRYICPMFCGLNEMVISNVTGMPPIIETPIRSIDTKSIFRWARKTARVITSNRKCIARAFEIAMNKQTVYSAGFDQNDFDYKVALLGHTYNINDTFINMNLVKKLNNLGIGVITEEYVSNHDIAHEVRKLFKRPFWYFAARYYGAAAHLYHTRQVDGIIYLSAFCCGVDSVITELIKNITEDFPLLILKLDEHTGEAGFNTRVEAYADMLKRRSSFEDHIPAHGQCVYRRESIV